MDVAVGGTADNSEAACGLACGEACGEACVLASALRRMLHPFTTCFASGSAVTLRLDGTRLVASKSSHSMSHSLRTSSPLTTPPMESMESMESMGSMGSTGGMAIRVPIGRLMASLAAFDDAVTLQLSVTKTVLRIECGVIRVDLLGRSYDVESRRDDAAMSQLFTCELPTIQVNLLEFARFAALADSLRLQDAILAVTSAGLTIRCLRNSDGTDDDQASLTMPLAELPEHPEHPEPSGLLPGLPSGLPSRNLIVSMPLLADLLSAVDASAQDATIGLATWGLRITWGDLLEAALMTAQSRAAC